MEEFFVRVKKVIESELSKKEEEILMTSSFVEDLGADSLDLVEVVMHLEEEFGITIPDDHVEQIKTVGDAVTYIHDKVSKGD